jgi:hypothetical protein
MFEIILFFFVFVPTLNLMRESKSTAAPIKMLVAFALIGVFTAFIFNEVEGKFLTTI